MYPISRVSKNPLNLTQFNLNNPLIQNYLNHRLKTLKNFMHFPQKYYKTCFLFGQVCTTDKNSFFFFSLIRNYFGEIITE